MRADQIAFSDGAAGYPLGVDRVQAAVDDHKRARETFVFRPTGTRSGMIWTSWADVQTAKDQCAGPKRILLDDQGTAPPEATPLVRLPAGTYDFTDCTLEGMPRGNSTRVDPDDGVVFENLEFIGPNIFLYVNNTVTPLVTLTSVKSFGLVNSSISNGNNATVPLIYVPPLLPATDAPILFLDGGEIQAGFGVANTVLVDEELFVAAGNLGSEIEDDSIEGLGTVQLVLFLPGGYALFSPWPPAQPGLAGLVVVKANLISAELTPGHWGGAGVPADLEEALNRIAAVVSAGGGTPIP